MVQTVTADLIRLDDEERGFDGIDINETQEFFNPLVTSKPVIGPLQDQTAYEDIDLVLDLSAKIHDDDTNKTDLD